MNQSIKLLAWTTILSLELWALNLMKNQLEFSPILLWHILICFRNFHTNKILHSKDLSAAIEIICFLLVKSLFHIRHGIPSSDLWSSSLWISGINDCSVKVCDEYECIKNTVLNKKKQTCITKIISFAFQM